MPRHAWIEIDLDAIEANTARDRRNGERRAGLRRGQGRWLWPRVGSAALAALAGGADILAVAMAEEGQVLRAAGVSESILLLSEPPADMMADVVAAGLTPTLYTAEGIGAIASAARNAAARNAAEGSAAGGTAAMATQVELPYAVHLKVDTGMHRVGADLADAHALARSIVAAPELRLAGVFTHFAVADEPDRPETAEQLERFTEVVASLRSAGIDPGLVHAANSAGLFAHPDAHLDMIRTGISLYGYPPAPELAQAGGLLEPALSLKAEVSMVRTLEAGEGISYGLCHITDRTTRVAVVPLGYADGLDRRLGLAGGEVLIRGTRCPIRGVVTMDQFVVEVPEGLRVERGDEVVLIGRQGNELITAQDWAELLGTISYEILCRFTNRVPKTYRGAVTGQLSRG